MIRFDTVPREELDFMYTQHLRGVRAYVHDVIVDRLAGCTVHTRVTWRGGDTTLGYIESVGPQDDGHYSRPEVGEVIRFLDR